MNPALIHKIAEKGKEIQATEKKIIGKMMPIVIVTLSIILIFVFGKKVVERIKENRQDKKGGSEINQWINRIQVAIHGSWTEDEEAAYQVAKEIQTRKMFEKTNIAYKNKYQITLEDELVKYFNNNELYKFYSYIK